MSIETTEPGKYSEPRVLVVDDDAKILRFVSLSLRLAGYKVFTATSGEEALKLAESEKVDIVVLDILMPVMDGFDVLKRLRAISDIPVIAISAHSSASEEALLLGADDFMDKPFRPEELTKKIKTLLNE